MALVEDIILSDPVLRKIMLRDSRFAPRSSESASTVSNLCYRLSAEKIFFQKAKTIAVAELSQCRMRALWFAIREQCDGYFIDMPLADDCEHVAQFTHDNDSRALAIDLRKRAALWHRYARRPPPPWREVDFYDWRAARRRRRGRF